MAVPVLAVAISALWSPSVTFAGGGAGGNAVTIRLCAGFQFESAVARLLGRPGSPSPPKGGTITFACSGDIAVAEPVTVGSGQTLVVRAPHRSVTFLSFPHQVSGSSTIGDVWQVFYVNGGTLDLDHVRFHGTGAVPVTGAAGASGGGDAPDAGQGGANFQKGGQIYIASRSTVEITDSAFTGALLVGYQAGGGGCGGAGSATAGGAGGKGGSAEGGAIYNAGTLTVTRTTFVDNRAQGGYGGFGGCGADSTAGPGGPGGSGGSGGKGKGGAIYNTGTLTVTDSTFIGNEALGGNGGAGGEGGTDGSNTNGPGDGGPGGSGGSGGKGGDARGGAIYSGPSFTLATTGQGTAPKLQVSHSTFRRDAAVGGVGGGSGPGGDGASQFPACEILLDPCGTAGNGGNGGAAGSGGDATGGAAFAGDIPSGYGAKARLRRNRFAADRVIAGGPGSNTDCGTSSGSGGPCYGLSGVDGFGNPAAANGQLGSTGGQGAAQDANVFNLYR